MTSKYAGKFFGCDFYTVDPWPFHQQCMILPKNVEIKTMSEFKFEIGKQYKVRDGSTPPWAKFIGEGVKQLAFEFPNGDVVVRNKEGRVYYNSISDFDILQEEYLEPVKYERFIWSRDIPGNANGSDFYSHVFGYSVFMWNHKKTDLCNRKYKITVEEIEE